MDKRDKRNIKKVCADKSTFIYVCPDFLKTQEMCNGAVREWPWLLEYVPGQYKIKEVCYGMVERYLSSSQFVPDWFATQRQLKIWPDYWFVSQQQLAVWYTEWY